MTGECKIYEIEVPNARAYAAIVSRYLPSNGDIAWFGYIRSEIRRQINVLRLLEQNGQLVEKGKEILRRLEELAREETFEAYVRAYCFLGNYGTALILRDAGPKLDWFVAFGLSEGDVERVKDAIGKYLRTMEEALEAIPNDYMREDFVDRCYYLRGGDADRCLEEAEDILEGRRLLAA